MNKIKLASDAARWQVLSQVLGSLTCLDENQGPMPRRCKNLRRNPLDPKEALALVGMSDRLDHFPSQLLAQLPSDSTRCSVTSPPARSITIPWQSIARVNCELGTTTAVITHNSAIAGMADRVLRLGGGRIVGEDANIARDSIWRSWANRSPISRPLSGSSSAMHGLMTDKRVRHEDTKVIGIVSIGDLLKHIISRKEFAIDQLEHYIQVRTC